MELDVRLQPPVANADVQTAEEGSEAQPTRFTNQGALPDVEEASAVHPAPPAASIRAFGRGAAATTEPVLTAPVERVVDGVKIVAPIGAHASAVDRAAEIVHQMLGANRFAQRSLTEQRTTIVIIPARTAMTDLAQFTGLRGQDTFDGRDWATVRGSGGMRAPDGSFAIGVAEENLISLRGMVSQYPPGYSIAMHELAHAIESQGLTSAQDQRLEQLFQQQQTQDARNATTHHDAFSDNYAASNKHEYFAQATNVFFGRNVGRERIGRRTVPNHNGRLWLYQNDPDMYAFMIDVYETQRDAEGERAQPAP